MTSSDDFTAKLVDISSKTAIRTFTGHTYWVRCAIFGNGIDIFTASADDRFKRWNRSSDNCIHTYSGHKDDVTCVIHDEINNNKIFSSSRTA